MGQDLRSFREAGYQLLSVVLLVTALSDGSAERRFADKKLACVTFDDGFLYDVQDMAHPEQGLVPSFCKLLNPDDQIPERFDDGPKAVAFVIASDQAGHDLRFSSDPGGYWDLRNDWRLVAGGWWLVAARGNTIAVAITVGTTPTLRSVKSSNGRGRKVRFWPSTTPVTHKRK